MNATQLATILKTLDETYGRDLFTEAVSEMLGGLPEAKKRGPGRPSTKTHKESGPYPKGEIPPHLQEWHAFLAEVKQEMIDAGWTHPETGKPPSHRDAMAEASRRKAASDDPEKVAKREAAKAKKAAKKADSDTESVGDKKKPGRPKMTEEQKAAKKAERAAAKKDKPKADKPKAEKPKKAVKKAEPKPDAAKAAAPMAEPEAEEAEEIEVDGETCVKLAGGYVYKYADGEVGDYLGQMNDEGELDTSVPDPAA
jgi:hypothetical protein